MAPTLSSSRILDRRKPVKTLIALAIGAFFVVPGSLFALEQQTSPPQPSLTAMASPEIWSLSWAGRKTFKDIMVLRADGQLWFEAAVIREFLPNLQAQGAWVASGEIPDFQSTFNESERVVDLNANPKLRPPQSLLEITPPHLHPLQQNQGALARYDLALYRAAGLYTFAAGLEGSWFGPWGTVSAAVTSTGGDFNRAYANYRQDFPGRNSTLTVGDTISGGLDWSTPLSFTGVRLSRNFGLQQNRVLISTPTLTGSAATPSTIDVFLSGRQPSQTQILDGPFEIGPPQGLSGAGQISVTVTDAMGRQQTITRSVYVTPRLLAKGVWDYSVEAGRLRGNTPDRFASGSFAMGVLPSMTLQAHIEASDRVRMAGLGVNWSPRQRFGVVRASAQRTDAGAGRYTLGYQWNNDRFGMDISAARTDPDFLDVATAAAASTSTPIARTDQSVSAWTLTRAGTFNLLLANGRDLDGPRRAGVLSWNKATRSGSWTVNVGRSNTEGWSTGVSWSLALDRVDLGADFETPERARRIYAMRQPEDPHGDYGWAAENWSDSVGSGSLVSGRIWRPEYELRAGAITGVGESQQIAASGAIVWLPGKLALRRSVPDAFALVRTGQPDVPLFFQNMPVGRTDADGDLLLTDVPGWSNVTTSIDAEQLDPNMDPEKWDVDFRIPSGRAAVIPMPVREHIGTNRILLQPDGTPLPPGVVVTMDADPSVRIPVGFGGQAYFDGPALNAKYRWRSCIFSITMDGPETVSCEQVSEDAPKPAPEPPEVKESVDGDRNEIQH